MLYMLCNKKSINYFPWSHLSNVRLWAFVHNKGSESFCHQHQFSSHCFRWTIDTGPPAALPGDLITSLTHSYSWKQRSAQWKCQCRSHSQPDNISVPLAPHTLTWSSHTDRVANGHFYESKHERVGHWTSPQRTPCSPINWSLLDLGWWFRGTL